MTEATNRIMRRLDACEEACTGIPTAALEAGAVARLIEAARAAVLTYAALERNRDSLIEALRAKGWPDAWLQNEIRKGDKLRAALAALGQENRKDTP